MKKEAVKAPESPNLQEPRELCKVNGGHLL